MKKQFKRFSKSTLAVVLTLCMLLSCVTAGIVATNAAQTDTEKVGGQYNKEWKGNTFFRVPDSWNLSTNSHVYLIITRATSGSDKVYQCPIEMTLVGESTNSRLYYVYVNADHTNWNKNEYLAFAANNSAKANGDWTLDSCAHYSNPYDYLIREGSAGTRYLFYPSDAANNIANTNNVLSAATNTSNRDVIKHNYSVHLKTGNAASAIGGSVDATFYYANGDNWTGSAAIASSTITVDASDETGSDVVETFENAVEGTMVTAVATPNDGYKFDGWYKDSSYATKVSSSATYTYYSYRVQDNLYAKFLADPVTDRANFHLIGDVGSDSIQYVKVNGVETTPTIESGKWPGEAGFALQNEMAVNNGSAGVYSITLKTKNVNWAINIGLYDDSRSVQRGYKLGDTWYNYVNGDYTVPYKGVTAAENLYIVTGSGSLVLLPDTEYTITIDQTQSISGYPYGKITITSNKADVFAIAKYKKFDISTGVLSSTVSNAPAAVGTAVAVPASGVKPIASSTLTATVTDETNYEFVGWYTNENCTEGENTNSEITVSVAADGTSVYRYALFKQKEPGTVTYTVTPDANGNVGTVTKKSGNKHAAGTAYVGDTLIFTATPNTGYVLDSVTSNSGVVAIKANDDNTANITVSNITQNTAVTVTFKTAPTYNLTFQIDSSTYGSLKATYYNSSGVLVEDAAVTNNQVVAVQQGKTVTIKGTATSTGSFKGWKLTGSYQRSKDTPLTNSTITIKPAENMTIKGLFVQKSSGSSSDYKIYFRDVGTETDNPSDVTLQKYDNATVTKGNSINWSNTTVYVGTFTAPSNKKINFVLRKTVNNSNTDYKVSNNGVAVDTVYLAKTGQSNYNELNFMPSSGTKYYVYVKVNGSDLDFFYSTKDRMGSSGGSDGDDDTIDTTGKPLIYVLDGIATRNDHKQQTFGTNFFGDSIILSSRSGVLKNNFYDATPTEQILVKEQHVRSEGEKSSEEGQTLYYYDPAVDLNFRVQTTITEDHQAIGVRAYVMNGITYPAKKSADGVYYADITLDANYYGDATVDQKTLEVIPVYYNTLIPDRDYIKFYVDANTIDHWGKTIGYSIWYKDTSKHGSEGGYPGQPLMKDGNLLYGYFPKYYVGVNATTLPEAYQRSKFSGVLLTNLAEHNYTHQAVLKKWGESDADSKQNFQTFDYEDPSKIAEIRDVDVIKFDAKYRSTNDNRDTGTNFNIYSKDKSLKDKNVAWKASITAPSAADTLNGFEILTDIDGNPVDIYNNKLTAAQKEDFDHSLFVVSVGNQEVGSNKWDTVWMVYDHDKTYKASKNPAEFIDVAAASQVEALKGKPVYILYEALLDGATKDSGNSGDRIDGRWLYSKSIDETTLRVRVATESSGTLTFKNGDFIDWTEVCHGDTYADLETGDNYTKYLHLNNRTTEVTAKINPVSYEVVGMYMLGSKFYSASNNGYSTSISDYDDLEVNGSATSFVNAKDNRMVIVIKEIPNTDLNITHQMYAGPGAHKIKGFYYLKAELYDSSDVLVATYNNSSTAEDGFTNKSIKIQNVAGAGAIAPKGDGYYFKIYIKTGMSGSSTFYQWYENDHNKGYDMLDSTDERGLAEPVTYVRTIQVDDLYGNLEENLTIKNLDYYSDLQASDSINVNHLLLPTTPAGLHGLTFVHATVVDSSGNTIKGGDYGAQASTTTVESTFISNENAEAGYQIKVEIWTVPTSPAIFDKFYRDTENVMTTGSSNGIAYTTGQHITVGEVEYDKATVMIPISYFFKLQDDGTGTGTLNSVFDSAKKDVNLYSLLKMTELKYNFVYQYNSRLYSTQTYTAKGDIDKAMFDEYFTFDGDDLIFQSDAKMQSFIGARAPYEDNYKEKITWDFTSCDADDTTFSNKTITHANFVAGQNLNRTVNIEFEFPYAYTASKTKGNKTYDYDVSVTPNKTTNENYKDDKGALIEFVLDAGDNNLVTYQPRIEGQSSDGKMQYLDWVSLNTRHHSQKEGEVIADAEPEFITAPEVIGTVTVDGGEATFTARTFLYWSMMYPIKDSTGATTYVEYQRCYSKAFNNPIYQDSKVKAVYGNAEAVAANQAARTADIKANVSFLENSRNQWNNGGGNAAGLAAKGAKDYWVHFGDRVFSDFVISFDYKNQQLNASGNVPYRAGLVVENCGALATDEGEKITSNAYYQDIYNAYSQEEKDRIKSNIGTKVEGNTSHLSKYDTNYYFSYINFNKLDPRNAIEYYYTFANVSMTRENELAGVINPTDYRNNYFRAFSFIVDENNNVTVSEPIYFTIYDVATVSDGNTLD